LIMKRFEHYQNINFLIRRDDSMFREEDRIDTLRSASLKDLEIEQLLRSYGDKYFAVDPGDVDAVMKHFRLNYEKLKENLIA